MVETLFEWLVLIDNCDVVDFIDLMEPLDAVLDQLSQLNSGLHSVGHALNNNVV